MPSRQDAVPRWAFPVGRALFAVVVVVASVWLLRRLDWRAVGRALAAAALLPLLAAAVLNFIHLGFRTVVLAALLAPVHPIPMGRLYRYNLGAVAVSTLLPVRGGELFRVWLLKTGDDVPRTTTVAVTLLEKAVDLVGLLAVAVPIPVLLPGLPRWIGVGIWGVAAALAAAMAAAVLISRLRSPRAGGALSRFTQGLRAIHRPGPFLLAIAAAIAAWATDAVEIWLVLLAVGLHLSLAAPLLVLLILNIAITVPATPAQIGAFELGGVAALGLLGVPNERALAFALLYHVIQVVPMSLAGLDALRLAWRMAPAPAGPR